MGTKVAAESSAENYQFQISLLEEVARELGKIDPELYDPMIQQTIISKLDVFENFILELFAQNKELFEKFNSSLSQKEGLSKKEITLEGLGNENLHERVEALLTALMAKRLPKDKPPATGSLDTLRDALESMTLLPKRPGDDTDDKWVELPRPRSPLMDPHSVRTVVSNGVVQSDGALQTKNSSIEASTHRVQTVVKQLLDLIKDLEKEKSENHNLRDKLVKMTIRAERAETRVKELERMLPTRLAQIRRSVSTGNLRKLTVKELT